MSKLQNDIKPEMVTAWAEILAGRSAKEVAKKAGVSDRTVYNWRKRVAEWTGYDEREQMKRSLYAFFDLACSSLETNLKKCDPTTTIAYLKGLQFFAEKTETEDMTRLSDDELAELSDAITERIASRSGAMGEDQTGTQAPS